MQALQRCLTSTSPPPPPHHPYHTYTHTYTDIPTGIQGSRQNIRRLSFLFDTRSFRTSQICETNRCHSVSARSTTTATLAAGPGARTSLSAFYQALKDKDIGRLSNSCIHVPMTYLAHLSLKLTMPSVEINCFLISKL